MVLEIASGLEDPKDVALRFGFDDEAWAALSTWQPFLNEVAAKRAELERGGYTFRMKAHMLAEDLLGDVYIKAKDNATSLPVKLDALKTFAKLADLEPKPNAGQVTAGGGFSITIQLPAQIQQLPPYLQNTPIEIIDVESKEKSDGDKR